VAAPVAIVLVVIAWLLLVRLYPTDLTDIKLDLSSLDTPELPEKRDRIIVTVLSLATLALITVALSNVMSNTATVSIVLPVVC